MLSKSGLAITTTVDTKHFTVTFTVTNDRETIFYHTFVRLVASSCKYVMLPIVQSRTENIPLTR